MISLKDPPTVLLCSLFSSDPFYILVGTTLLKEGFRSLNEFQILHTLIWVFRKHQTPWEANLFGQETHQLQESFCAALWYELLLCCHDLECFCNNCGSKNGSCIIIITSLQFTLFVPLNKIWTFLYNWSLELFFAQRNGRKGIIRAWRWPQFILDFDRYIYLYVLLTIFAFNVETFCLQNWNIKKSGLS